MSEPDWALQRLGSIAQRRLEVDQPLHTVGLARFCDDCGTRAVDEGVRLPIVRILVGSRGMHHHVRAEVCEQSIHQTAVHNRVFHQLEVGMQIEIVASPRAEIIDRMDMVTASEQQFRDMRPDLAATARNEYFHCTLPEDATSANLLSG